MNINNTNPFQLWISLIESKIDIYCIKTITHVLVNYYLLFFFTFSSYSSSPSYTSTAFSSYAYYSFSSLYSSSSSSLFCGEITFYIFLWNYFIFLLNVYRPSSNWTYYDCCVVKSMTQAQHLRQNYCDVIAGGLNNALHIVRIIIYIAFWLCGFFSFRFPNKFK